MHVLHFILHWETIIFYKIHHKNCVIFQKWFHTCFKMLLLPFGDKIMSQKMLKLRLKIFNEFIWWGVFCKLGLIFLKVSHFFIWFVQEHNCRNLNLGLATKARACKGAIQEWSPRFTFHAPENARECEGMKPHTPKWTPIFRVGVPMDSWIFKGQL
jgi:hypothetical protein